MATSPDETELADDVAGAFTDEAAVNDALRAYLRGQTVEPAGT